MGLADRDYMRQRPPRRSRSPVIAVVLGAAVAFLIVSGLGKRGIEKIRADHARVPSFGISLAPGVQVKTAQPPRDDPWKSFLAPESSCPGREASDAPPALQQQTAMCLLNYARQREGLAALPELSQLTQWSMAKAADIVRCNDFAHTPCGEAANRYPLAAGYTGAFGENIYMGPQIYKTPLAAVDGWLNSEHHRENLFRPEWRYQGIALLHTDGLNGQHDVAVWVSEFGT